MFLNAKNGRKRIKRYNGIKFTVVSSKRFFTLLIILHFRRLKPLLILQTHLCGIRKCENPAEDGKVCWFGRYQHDITKYPAQTQ